MRVSYFGAGDQTSVYACFWEIGPPHQIIWMGYTSDHHQHWLRKLVSAEGIEPSTY
jgi:hypothetical protein